MPSTKQSGGESLMAAEVTVIHPDTDMDDTAVYIRQGENQFKVVTDVYGVHLMKKVQEEEPQYKTLYVGSGG